jgi:2-dehydropantoate 2-reductase
MMGACLARIGEAVTMVGRLETLPVSPSKVQLESPFGNASVDVTWAKSVQPTDVLWLTVKATQLESALGSIRDPKSVGAMVPLLNGLDHIELLRSKFGADRVIPATIGGEMERVSPGHFVHRSPFAILNILATGRALLQSVCERLRGIGFICNFMDDETTLMWSKLVFLAPIALTTSAFDKTVGEVEADPKAWAQFEACVRETAAAGKAEGANLDPETVLKLVKGAPFAMRSSMQKDVAAGLPPELDAIGGAILRAAKQHGLDAAITKNLMAQIECRRGVAREIA